MFQTVMPASAYRLTICLNPSAVRRSGVEPTLTYSAPICLRKRSCSSVGFGGGLGAELDPRLDLGNARRGLTRRAEQRRRGGAQRASEGRIARIPSGRGLLVWPLPAPLEPFVFMRPALDLFGSGPVVTCGIRTGDSPGPGIDRPAGRPRSRFERYVGSSRPTHVAQGPMAGQGRRHPEPAGPGSVVAGVDAPEDPDRCGPGRRRTAVLQPPLLSRPELWEPGLRDCGRHSSRGMSPGRSGPRAVLGPDELGEEPALERIWWTRIARIVLTLSWGRKSAASGSRHMLAVLFVSLTYVATRCWKAGSEASARRRRGWPRIVRIACSRSRST